MVINPAKPTKVEYKAKGAQSYSLELRMIPRSDPKLLAESSKDGSFLIDVRKFGEKVVGQAIESSVGESWRRMDMEDNGLEKLQVFVKSITKPFREGRLAEREAASLVLMEVPLALVRDSLEGGARGKRGQ